MSIALVLFIGIVGFVIARIVACIATRVPVPASLKLALGVAILFGAALLQRYLTSGQPPIETVQAVGSEDEGPWPFLIAGLAMLFSLGVGYLVMRWNSVRIQNHEAVSPLEPDSNRSVADRPHGK